MRTFSVALTLALFIQHIQTQDHIDPDQNGLDQTFMDPKFCQVRCHPNQPCEYSDEVDFRIILLASKRPDSLRKSLDAISKLYVPGWNVSVDIWIGKDEKQVLGDDLAQAEMKKNWKVSRLCIHHGEDSTDPDSRWLNAWRPKRDTNEIALILEDDVNISSRTFLWLLLAHQEYDSRGDVAGYALRMTDSRFLDAKQSRLKGPDSDNAFLYERLDVAFGFSPHAAEWRRFQDWYLARNSTETPQIPEASVTNEPGNARAAWEQWHVRFSLANKLFTVYCNLHVKYCADTLLSVRRMQYSDGGPAESQDHLLISRWQPEYGMFPEAVQRYSHDGNIVL